MKEPNVARIRMRTQRLWGRGFDTPEDVVGFLGAVQSQEFPYAKWSVAQRTRGATDAQVHDAFAAGRILRTHVLRPTWHFVLPEDIRWMLELTAPRVKQRMRLVDSRIGLDAAAFAKTNRIVEKALADGRHRTRAELGEELRRGRVGDPTGQRLGHIVMRAELDGVICSGAPIGRQHTYALIDQRAPTATTFDREAALAELVRRYFTSHGPATLKDFVWWSGLATADARSGLHSVAGDLGSEVVDGRTYWFADRASPRGSSPRVDLVQCYDEAVIAYSESRDVLTADRLRSYPGGQTPYMHAVVLDGRLAGLWKHSLGKGSASIQVSAMGRLDRASLERAASRYGRFLGLPVELTMAR